MKSSFTALAVAAGMPMLASAATHVHDFNITWTTANPDGQMERPVIGINGQWPIPALEATIGDRMIVHVHNQLGNQSTSLHFHGQYQNGSTEMDGAAGTSQCSLPPGSSMTYDFNLTQSGTYWYHSHDKGQYPDGLRGPFVIHDPDFPYQDEVDEDLTITLSDWYHDQMADLIPPFMAKSNPSGAEPVPKAALMNETQDFKLPVKPGKTYLLRLVNIGAFAGQYFWIEGHTMKIVEVDGIFTEQAEASMVYLGGAQRCSVLVTTHNDTSRNFPMVASMDTTLFDVLPPKLNYNVTGWLVYNDEAEKPAPATVDTLDPYDDVNLVPHDKMEILGEPDHNIELNVIMDNLRDGSNYAFFNNITFTSPKVPSLYTVMSSGDMAEDATIYGQYTNPQVLKRGDIVQVVVNNLDSGRHPFHLHGHVFQTIYRSEDDAGTFEDENVSVDKYKQTPMRRDTIVLYPNGNLVFRFRADNPGVWLFHCHIEWHIVGGLVTTFIEAPLDIQKQFTLPQDHIDACKAGGVAWEGNAAANTADLLDLTGENKAAGRLPEGFTPRGIVALVFSIITGILGVIVVAWYGLAQPVDTMPGFVDGTLVSQIMDDDEDAQRGVAGARASQDDSIEHEGNGAVTAANAPQKN